MISSSLFFQISHALASLANYLDADRNTKRVPDGERKNDAKRFTFPKLSLIFSDIKQTEKKKKKQSERERWMQRFIDRFVFLCYDSVQIPRRGRWTAASTDSTSHWINHSIKNKQQRRKRKRENPKTRNQNF